MRSGSSSPNCRAEVKWHTMDGRFTSSKRWRRATLERETCSAECYRERRFLKRPLLPTAQWPAGSGRMTNPTGSRPTSTKWATCDGRANGLALWIILLNPPFSDHTDPTIQGISVSPYTPGYLDNITHSLECAAPGSLPLSMNGNTSIYILFRASDNVGLRSLVVQVAPNP